MAEWYGSTRCGISWRLNFSLVTGGSLGDESRQILLQDLIYADELALIGDDDNPVSQTDSGTGGIRKIEKDCEVELYDRSYSASDALNAFYLGFIFWEERETYYIGPRLNRHLL